MDNNFYDKLFEWYLVIVGHAIARTPTLQNKAENAVESLSLQATPMGILLSWLGAKPIQQQQQTTKRR